MYSEFLSCGSVVRSHMRTWSQSTKKRMIVVSRYYTLDYFHSLRNFITVLLELDIMKEQVENIPRSTVISKRPYLILWNILWSIGRAAIRLKSFFTSQLEKLFSNYGSCLLKFKYPFKLLSFPPSFQWKPWYQIRTAKLARMVLFRDSLSVYSHKEPLSQSIYIFVLRISNLVFYELFASQFREAIQMIIL